MLTSIQLKEVESFLKIKMRFKSINYEDRIICSFKKGKYLSKHLGYTFHVFWDKFLQWCIGCIWLHLKLAEGFESNMQRAMLTFYNLQLLFLFSEENNLNVSLFLMSKIISLSNWESSIILWNLFSLISYKGQVFNLGIFKQSPSTL